MPGFDQVLAAVADAWRHRRAQAVEQAQALVDHLAAPGRPAERIGHGAGAGHVDAGHLASRAKLRPRYGGFGSAPKFPHPMDLRLLLHQLASHAPCRPAGNAHHDARHAWPAAAFTTSSAAAFIATRSTSAGSCRISRKCCTTMPCSCRATSTPGWSPGRHDYARVARETCDYVLREMTDAAGGFYSTQDADSEGEEGKFFVWTPAEVAAVLGDEPARTFCYVYDVSDEGNFEQARTFSIAPRRSTSVPRCSAATATNWSASWPSRGRGCWPRARSGSIPRCDDKVLVGVERADDRCAGAGRRTARRAAVPASRATGGRLHPRVATLARRPAVALLASRPGEARRLSRRLRGAGQCAGLVVRSRLRRAVDRRGDWAGRHDAATVPRRGVRRLLFHCQRPRAADHPPEGSLRQRRAQRELAGGHGAVAAGKADRARRLSGCRRGARLPPRRP